MSDSKFAISVNNISKCYRIGVKDDVHENFAGMVVDFLKSPFKNYRKYRSLYKFDDVIDGDGTSDHSTAEDVIWALRDVSFQVREGEVLGIIGHNGAGKSTLLKLLSRITDPTIGRAEIRGQVSSLLEVGTGFHPELTGRENIYLNGTILGMTKRDVDRKYDEIIEFSGVGKFIDTPVKRYSSGMKVRLAFSVAAHMEPEILIIDEVLAVGDETFQKKCLGKMDQVADGGRTVLFVSHNLAAIQSLCNRVLVLDGGRVAVNAPTAEGISAYLNMITSVSTSGDVSELPRMSAHKAVIQKIKFLGQNGKETDTVTTGSPLRVQIHYDAGEELLKNPYFGMAFENHVGVKIFWVQTLMQKGRLPDLKPAGVIECNIPRLPLLPGSYFVSSGCGAQSQQLDHVQRARQLNVTAADVFGTGRLPPERRGLVIVDADWDVVDGLQ